LERELCPVRDSTHSAFPRIKKAARQGNGVEVGRAAKRPLCRRVAHIRTHMSNLNIPLRRGQKPFHEAVRAAELGWAVARTIPGEKHPREKWAQLGYREPDEVQRLWAERRSGTAVLCGPSDLVCIDIDGELGEDSLAVLLDGHELPETFEQSTPSSGRHLVFLQPESGVRISSQNGWRPGIDIKGDGGLFILHDPDKPYEVTGNVYPVDLPEWLCRELPVKGKTADQGGNQSSNGSNGSGKVDVRNLLVEGKVHDTLRDLAWMMRNAGLPRELFLSIPDAVKLAPHHDGEPYTRDEIEHEWDSADGKIEADDGMPSRGLIDRALSRLKASELARSELKTWMAEREGDDGAFERVDLLTAAEELKVPIGADGVFIDHGLAWLFGAAGAGKSLLAYWTLLQRIRAGQRVAVYEVEMGVARVKGLLRNLGATDAELSLLSYYSAPEDGTVADLVANGRALDRKLRKAGIGNLLYDAANPLLAAAGLNEDKAGDIRTFANTACKPITDRGGFVLVIDHSGHSEPNRIRGSSDKPAAGDFIVGLLGAQRFRRGVSGSFTLVCKKDRTGEVDGMTMGVKVVAYADGSVELEPEGWLDIGRAQPIRQGANTQQKIRLSIAETGRPATIPEIMAKTGLSRDAVRSALNRGATGGNPVFTEVRKGEWDESAE